MTASHIQQTVYQVAVESFLPVLGGAEDKATESKRQPLMCLKHKLCLPFQIHSLHRLPCLGGKCHLQIVYAKRHLILPCHCSSAHALHPTCHQIPLSLPLKQPLYFIVPTSNPYFLPPFATVSYLAILKLLFFF